MNNTNKTGSPAAKKSGIKSTIHAALFAAYHMGRECTHLAEEAVASGLDDSASKLLVEINGPVPDGGSGRKYEEWEAALRRELSARSAVPLTPEELASVGFYGRASGPGYKNPETLVWPDSIRFDILIEPIVGSSRVSVSFRPSIFWVSAQQMKEMFRLKAAQFPQVREIETPEKVVSLPIPAWVEICGTYDGCLGSITMFESEAKTAYQEFCNS